MADTNTAREPRDLAPDLVGVKSRVSWSAILAGAVIALAVYFVLTLLFGAIGISLTDAGVRDRAVAIGVLVAMIASVIIALFTGGWVAAQLTAGENRQEAVIYGLLTWATVSIMALFLVAAGLKAGYFAAVGGSMVAQNSPNAPNWKDGAKALGATDAQITSFESNLDKDKIAAAANDPANQERAREAAMTAAWTALVATMLGMAACVGGALVGAGTAFRIYPVRTVRTDTGPRLIVPTA
jgi:hypothetical protein